MGTTLKQQLKDAGYDGLFDLTSLLEACGKDFRLQNSNPSLWQADNCGDFNQWDKDEHTFGTGLTPEEAVANLWLALHKK